MDTRRWTLKCRDCGRIFRFKLTAGKSIIQFASHQPCPACKEEIVRESTANEPLASEPQATLIGNWQVIGFHAISKR